MTNHKETSYTGLGQAYFQKNLDTGLGDDYKKALDGVRKHVTDFHGVGADEGGFNALVTNHLSALIRNPSDRCMDDALLFEMLDITPTL
jgi:hypothetical protein